MLDSDAPAGTANFTCCRPGCGRSFHMAPSFAKRRRYCSVECRQMDRPIVTEAHRMIRELGGFTRVAKRLAIEPRSVRAWYRQGLPSRYHLAILAMAARLKVASVTREKLEKTCEDGRALRAAARAAKSKVR